MLEPVHNIQSPGFYSTILLVPKKTGGVRPIIDLSTLNLHVPKIKFKMDTPLRIRSVLAKNWDILVRPISKYQFIPALANTSE